MSLQQLLFTGQAETDPYFSSVSLLLHCDGSNGSTSFPDNSSNGFTVTANNTTVSTSQYKFGTGSAYFSGTSSYLTTPTNSAFANGTGDFTWESWVYISTNTGTFQTFFDTRTSGSGYTDGLFFGVDYSLTPIVYGTSTLLSASSSLSTGGWYFLALTRSSSTLRLFIDGTQSGGSASNSTNMSNSKLWISTATDGSTNPLKGYLDEIRITKGVARYTSSFTAPTSAFPNS